MHILILDKNITNLKPYSDIVKPWETRDSAEPEMYHVSDMNSFLHLVEKYAKGKDDFLAGRIEAEDSEWNEILQKAKGPRRILLNLRGKTAVLKEEDIVYCERHGRTTYVHCQKETYGVSTKISSFEEQFSPEYFVRCHNSFIVNLDAVKEFTRSGFVLTGDVKIPISKQRIGETRKKFFDWVNRLP